MVGAVDDVEGGGFEADEFIECSEVTRATVILDQVDAWRRWATAAAPTAPAQHVINIQDGSEYKRRLRHAINS